MIDKYDAAVRAVPKVAAGLNCWAMPKAFTSFDDLGVAATNRDIDSLSDDPYAMAICAGRRLGAAAARYLSAGNSNA